MLRNVNVIIISLCAFASIVDQRNLGMSMKVERSTLDDVKERFQQVKKKKSEEKKQYGMCVSNHKTKEYTLVSFFDRLQISSKG